MNVAVNKTKGQCYIYCFRVVVCEQIWYWYGTYRLCTTSLLLYTGVYCFLFGEEAEYARADVVYGQDV